MRTRLSTISSAIALSVILLLNDSVALDAQEYNNTPVTVSKEKVKVGGKVCYSHIVLEKQTLYSISKAYEVSIEDIYRFNPTLQEVGLKKNSIIIIPSADALKEDVKTVEEKPAVQEVIVTEKQEVAEKKEVVEKKETKEPKKRYHVRKWYEDLDMIAAQYGVSAEEIMAANNLTSKELVNRQKLLIPQGGVQPQESVEEITAELQNEDIQTTSSEEEPLESQIEWLAFPSKPVHTTLLLPMRNMEGKLSRNNMDFYSGVMLAVHDLAQKGINIDISAYDITDQNTPVTKEDIEKSDVIIGPISAADQIKLFQTPAETGAVVSPLDPRSEKLLVEYKDLIQAPTPHRIQYQDLTNWIKEEMGENDKVFMFSERTVRVNDAVTMMKEIMDSSGIEYTPFIYSILEGRDILEPLKEMMTQEGANRVYIASESEAFVNDVVRNLNLMLLENFEVVLYAPSKIRSFDTIEVEHFHKTAMRVSLTYFINYEDRAVKDFLLKYRAIYNTEPSQFAFQGYDIATYFIDLCNKYGKNWVEKLEDSEKEMLQSTFNFAKMGTGGHVNTGVRRIIYGPNWTISKVK